MLKIEGFSSTTSSRSRSVLEFGSLISSCNHTMPGVTDLVSRRNKSNKLATNLVRPYGRTVWLLILASLNSARAGSKSAQDSSFWIWLDLYLDLGSCPLSPSSDSVHLALILLFLIWQKMPRISQQICRMLNFGQGATKKCPASFVFLQV